jgi:hypothetical protein
MKRMMIPALFTVLTLFAFAPVQQNTKGQIWADCRVYGTVITPTDLPMHGNFDELYMNPAGFKNGIMSISETKPGDMDYNGGRWHVNELKAGVNPMKYANACSVEDLDLNDFTSTETYFVCPLMPRK